jgi:hypothetical protein
MSIEEISEVEKKRWRLELARRLVGGAAIVAILAAVLSGVVAFREERDVWLAMRLPSWVAFLFTWSFARIAREILALKSKPAR